MLINYNNTLTVSNNSDLGSRGSFALSANGIVYQPTQVVDPNDNPASGNSFTGNTNAAAVSSYQLANTNRTITLDDGNASVPASLPYVNSEQTVRVGSTISNLTGILGYGFNAYRIQPVPYAYSAITYAARPALPDWEGKQI